jgi:hypothetical protein
MVVGIEFLISLFEATHEVHKKWFAMNNNEINGIFFWRIPQHKK